ncbi:uncharacterized protein LOC111861443 isoform X2 [Cryptotermes secundus]|uniref:uncharacterized protein LOC111861443 isoform X2 n=1 Tax=Cryptotermes secundus TaxID=105785 RepID=UPI000CD7C38C|nr:uncharacterized protein LOC111861443 isoform X2 [Cryptotermes secundus]
MSQELGTSVSWLNHGTGKTMQRSGRLHLREVNQHLVCVLCGGYYIDATTIVECLHSFCRSCLIRYLESNSFCPICDVQIHKAKPFLNIKPDKALQDIVYKLVPGLFHAEMRRRHEFYAKHPERANETTPEGRGVGVERLIYSPDDSISLSLEYLDGEHEDLGCMSSRSSVSDSSTSEVAVSKRYLQCPALVTIAHLKKFLRLKYELNPSHSVEVIHMWESLPDEYTLMDVAYIYTWKRNGPMKFFYRISQTQKDLASSLVEKQLPAVINSASAEQSSPTPPTSQLPSTVSRLPETNSSDGEHDSERLPKTAAVRTSGKSTQIVTTTVSTHTLSGKATTVCAQPEIVTTVTKSISQPSSTVLKENIEELPTPVQIKYAVPTTTPLNITSSQLPQSTLPEIGTQGHTRFVTSPPLISITKTTSTSNPMNPVTSPDAKTPVPAPTTIIGKTELSPSTSVSKSSVQQETPSVTLTTVRQQPAPTVLTKQPPVVADTGLTTPQASTDTALKELSGIHVAKTAAQSPSTNGAPPSNKSSNDSNFANNGHVLSDTVPGNNKPKPSSPPPPPPPPVRPGNADGKILPAHMQPAGNFTVKCEETAGVSFMDRLLTEVNNKTATESGIATYAPPDTVSKVKPPSSKHAQQRTQMFATKSSPFIKVTPDATNNKIHLSTAKFPANKEATRLPCISQKVTDKHASNCLTLRKDKVEDSNKKDFRKESTNNISAPEKRQEKQSTKSTPLASNNSNTNNNNIKVPQQSIQVIKNNQQILKKNDEIMRCSNNFKRTTHILPRKPQDMLKACGVPARAQEDKSISKKRCVLAANPVKRPLGNPADATEQKDMEPVAKKWRLGVENNHNAIHVAQKSNELKVKNIPSSGECQAPKKVTQKSDASEVSPIVSKGSNAHFQLPAHIEKTELQKNHSLHKNSLADNVRSSVTLQRPAHNNQTNVFSKQYDIQCRDPTSKFETTSPKSDVILSQVPGSSACVRNVQSTPVSVPAAAHCNASSRLQPPALPDGERSNGGALDLSASPRRQQQGNILSIAQTLARRHQQHCPSPAPPPLSPLSSLSPFPVMSLPVRSPPPQLRIPVPQHHRSGHSQQQRPSSLSSSSPSPPADILPGCSRSGLQQQQPLDMYPPHLLPSSAVMFRQQLEMQRLWNSGKHSPNPRMEWFNDAKSMKSFDNFMKTLQQQQQGNRSSSFYPYNNNTTAAPNSHRK